jgi:hypothetical protein
VQLVAAQPVAWRPIAPASEPIEAARDAVATGTGNTRRERAHLRRVWHHPQVSLLIAAGLLVACLILALLPRRDVPGRGLALLRCFFPSWRFFEQIEPGPALQVCTAAPNEEFGPWRVAWHAAPRTAAALIINSRGNLELAYQSLVDQLWSEIEDAPENPAGSITYALVQRLIEVESLQAFERIQGCRYRFRLSFTTTQESTVDEAASESHAFVSAEHEIGSS